MPWKSQLEPSAMSSLALSRRSAVSLGRRTGRVMRSHSLQQEEDSGTVPKLLVLCVERRATFALSAPRKRRGSKKPRHRRGPLMARFTEPWGVLQWACRRRGCRILESQGCNRGQFVLHRDPNFIRDRLIVDSLITNTSRVYRQFPRGRVFPIS